MRERREVWKKLSEETQEFVLKYLRENLKLKESEFENFLFPEFEKNLLDGRAMHDMDKAVERILRAIVEEEKIAVYGDYDCDGVPGTALLRDFFEKINYNRVVYYIPHRHTEGYGLNKKAIDILAEQGVSLMITIDLGTTNIEEVEYANSQKIDTIVTDHHLPVENDNGQILPKAYAIINNKKSNCLYANKDLCGSGTIFKLVVELINALRFVNSASKEKVWPSGEMNSAFTPTVQTFSSSANLVSFNWNNFEKLGVKIPQVGYEKWLLDLVAIATIADMVPLTHENRNLVIYGLHVLSKTNRAGLQTLFKNGSVDIKKVNETDIAFTVAPRINSASRMSSPKIALSMFSQNLVEGVEAAHELEELNKNRKETTKNIVKKIYKILDERIENSTDKKLPEVLVIGSHDWNAGVLGILASKILDKYNVNVFVFGQDESDERKFKGSCRSRGDIHLVKLMSTISSNFLHFGGHELAGGFSISFENLHTLENDLNKNIEVAKIENESEKKMLERVENVITINLEKINYDFFEGLKLIGPYGMGNPKPIFKIENILETKTEKFGKNKEHLKLKLVGKNFNNSKYELEAIKFFAEESDVEKILEKYRNGGIFFEIEGGWMSAKPRLKIIF